MFKNLFKRWKLRRHLKRLESMLGDTPPGETDADYWFTKELELAAMQGDPVAQSKLATAYHEGLGVEQNPTRAFNFWLAAAEQGHAGAQAMICAAYHTGTVATKDPVEALFWAVLNKEAKNPLGEALFVSLFKKSTIEQRQAVDRLMIERTSFRP